MSEVQASTVFEARVGGPPSRSARRLAAGFLVLLPAHWGLAEWVNKSAPEPWPVASLPSFGTTFKQGRVAVRIPYFVAELANGETRRLMPREMFSEVHRSLHYGIMKERFPIQGPMFGNNPSAVEWLSKRCATLLGQRPASLTVQWREEALEPNGRAATKLLATRPLRTSP